MTLYRQRKYDSSLFTGKYVTNDVRSHQVHFVLLYSIFLLLQHKFVIVFWFDTGRVFSILQHSTQTKLHFKSFSLRMPDGFWRTF